MKLKLTVHKMGRKYILGRKNSLQTRPKSSSKSLKQEKIG